MIEALKSLLNLAATARKEGHRDDAERLYKEAAEEARAQDAVGRAEALCGSAQIRRDKGDRIGASIYYSEAITLLRNEHTNQPELIAPTLAFALRHAADVRSQLGEFAVAGSHIQESVRLYRTLRPVPGLDLANALRIQALNNEREALAAWTEAHGLYAELALNAGVEEAVHHLEHLLQIASADHK